MVKDAEKTLQQYMDGLARDARASGQKHSREDLEKEARKLLAEVNGYTA